MLRGEIAELKSCDEVTSTFPLDRDQDIGEGAIVRGHMLCQSTSFWLLLPDSQDKQLNPVHSVTQIDNL